MERHVAEKMEEAWGSRAISKPYRAIHVLISIPGFAVLTKQIVSNFRLEIAQFALAVKTNKIQSYSSPGPRP